MKLPVAAAFFALVLQSSAATVPAPEQLVPADALAIVTAPDFAQLSEGYRNSAQRRFWEDPAMKASRDRFMARWQEEFVRPLEHDLGVSLDSYSSLPKGQMTFALVQNGWQGRDDQPLGFFFLMDTKDQGKVLKTNLAELRKKWVDAGKTVKTETIRGIEFSIYPIASNNLPKTIRKFFPPPYEFSGPPGEVGAKKPPGSSDSAAGKLDAVLDTIAGIVNASGELVVGQSDSLLIVGNAAKVVEQVAIRLTGGALPPLADSPAFQASQQALFRNAPFYGWINTKLLVDILSRKPPEPQDSDVPDPFEVVKPDKILRVTGLTGLKSVAFSLQISNEGTLFQIAASAPESGREGFLKILAGEAKETKAPVFVPADTVKFWRYRLDCQKSWATLERMLKEGSPQTIGTLNWILETAAARAKETDPGFDLKQELLCNLGDDIVNYEKAPAGTSPAELRSPASLLLLGSPAPEHLASALKALFVIFPQGDTFTERDFLGRKIFSVPLPALPLPIPTQARPGPPRTLNFAASASYVALSTDPAMLEEYLRSSDGQARALRERPGLAEAADKVGGLGMSLFGYENEEDTMRTTFETLKRDPAAAARTSGLSPFPGLPGFTGAEKNFKGWLDPALLPPFDRVAQYFYFTVYGASATVDGLTLKYFTPVPPALRSNAAAAAAK